MSDQPSVTVETVIEASPESVYAAATDLEVLGKIGTEFEGGEWLSGSPASNGSVFLGRQRNGDTTWETTSTVVSARPGREFAWEVELDPETGESVAKWQFSLRTVPDGTEVRYSVVLGSGESRLTSIIERNPDAESEIIEKRLLMFQENMVKTLEGIRRVCA